MSAFIGISAMLLFSTVNLEMMIAGNNRRISQAKISAASGLNSLGLGLGLGFNVVVTFRGRLKTIRVV